MKLRFILLFLFVMPVLMLQAQQDSTADDSDEEPVLVIPKINPDFKIGVKLGSGASIMLGQELDNAGLTYVLTGGMYIRYKFRPRSAVQMEAYASFRGSNFNNSNGEISSIRTYYLDVPVLWVYSLTESQLTHMVLGLQYSYLFNADLYVKPNVFPEKQTPKLLKSDCMAVGGVQFYTPFVGFQILAKYGLLDINKGLINNLKPAYKGKDIHNFAVEINLLF